MYAFGRVMRRLMKERHVKQYEIVNATGITKQNMSLICQGKTQYPSIHTCKQIADFFGLTLDELWELMKSEEKEDTR